MPLPRTSPHECYLYLRDKNFDADLVFPGTGLPYFRVNIPSGPGSLRMEVDDEFKADPVGAIDSLIEAVIEETLPHETCAGCVERPIEDGCTECWPCRKCARHILKSKFDEHSWWCRGERYRPLPQQVQGDLFSAL